MSTVSTIQKPVLQLGSQATEVKELQVLLKRYGYDLSEDGSFGIHTKNAVSHFQSTKFLEPDGIVGNKTWRALFTGAPVDMPVLRPGACQPEVQIVQDILSQLQLDTHSNHSVPYYTGAIDSLYGAKTESSVKAFQKNSGLVADGIIGEKTWHGLSQHSYLTLFAC